MTANIHRVIMVVAGVAAAVGGLIAQPSFSTLGIPEAVGAWLALAAGIAGIVGTTIRVYWPDTPA